MDMTKFHEKNLEFAKIKKQSQSVMSQFNSLHCNYSDWYKRQQQSFVDVIKAVQVSLETLVPQEIRTIHEFRRLVNMATRLKYKTLSPKSQQKLEQFLNFWDRFCDLKETMDNIVMKNVEEFLSGISKLRDPEVKQELDRLRARLNAHFSENFDFHGFNNEKDNLYTYRLMVCDNRFLGLIGYLPFLINFAARICYLVGRIYIEKV